MNTIGSHFSKMTLFFIAWLFAFSQLAAQEKHFVFIQSENKLPFYIQYNNQTFSSTASGYATLSQLLAGKYYISIGFPKNKFPEQKFVLDVNRTDWGTGYSLKRFGEKGWGLLNIVDYSIVMADQDSLQNRQATEIVKRSDGAKPAETIVNSTMMALPVIKKITKTFETFAATSVNQIYVDNSRKKSDTIALSIPLDLKQDVVAIVSKCNSIATDEDFYKTRLDMVTVNSHELMMQTAKNYFRTKCYTTAQTKNLGVLFLTEEQRFLFFEMVRQNIADAENYATLQSQFTQLEWKEKFLASIKNN